MCCQLSVTAHGLLVALLYELCTYYTTRVYAEILLCGCGLSTYLLSDLFTY